MPEVPPHTRDAGLRQVLSDLVVTNYRVTRLAAQLTGSSETSATWAILSVLNSYGPVRLGELARSSRVSQPTMTKLVKGLLDMRWVERAAHPGDARAARIAITTEGATALEEWRKELADALVPLFTDLTDPDLAVLQRTVEILNQRLHESVNQGE